MTTILDSTKNSEQPIDKLKLLVLSISSGIILGGFMNLINGLISHFFIDTGWNSGITASFVIEGFAFGLIFSILFTIITFLAVHKQKESSFIFKLLGTMLLIIVLFWVIGGLLGMLLSHSFPEIYDQAIGFDREISSKMGFSWVVGSIIGEFIGSIIAFTFGFIKTR